MSQDSENKRNRVNLTIPYSFLEKVDQHVQARLEDGESRETANRSAFVMEMFKLGLRVHENSRKKGPDEKTLDEKLELIAKNSIITGFVVDAIFGVQKETIDQSRVIKNASILDPEWLEKMKEQVAGRLKKFFP
ncbi:hypothetical protein IBT47_26620 [Erwinia sp. S43]|uniref:relaxosome protein TraM n=1 Tax=Erwinia sp. S43 TaxID=2769339 RepID=UPI00190BE693|nr:hypothetical protein [Erwinia sp. S43]MBK0035848.1 hypothetical protein [Erwinia sp. S43]